MMKLTKEETLILSFLCTCDRWTCSTATILNHFIGIIDINKGKKILYGLKETGLISISWSGMVTCLTSDF